MKISQDNIAQLVKNNYLSTLPDNSYTKDTQNPNFRYIAKKFFLWETEEKIKTINTSVWLFGTMTNIYASYVSSPDYDQDLDIEELTKDFITFGFACVWLATRQTPEWIEGYIVHLPAQWYFRQDGINRLAKVYRKIEDDKTAQFYVYIQSFYPWYTENKLYRSTYWSVLDFEYLTEVPLTMVQQTEQMQEIQRHPRNKPAIYIVKEDDMDIYPSTSMIQEVMHHVYAMDRKKVMFDCEFLKNVDSFVLFKNIDLPKKAQTKRECNLPIDMTDFGRYIEAEADSSIEFINNTNALIKDAMESQKDDMRIFSTISNIPMDFLWMETAHGSIWKGSRWLLHGSFTKRVEKIRKMWDRYLIRIIEDLQQIKKSESDRYSRPDVFSKSDTELVEELQLALTNNLITHQRAIMLYMWYTQEQAEEEMQAIVNEKILFSSVVNGSQNTPSDS